MYPKNLEIFRTANSNSSGSYMKKCHEYLESSITKST